MESNEVQLNCGIKIPNIGLGTFSYHYKEDITNVAVKMALKMGYRHFDTAKIYGSEPAVGKALTDAMEDRTVKREEIFVTSKLWGSDHNDPVSGLKETLQKLGMEYVDMYLVHWPVKLKPWVQYPVPNEEDFEPLDMETTWSGMEKCLEMGLCKGIGVSNFSTKKIQRLLDFASVHPAINQVEMHPMWKQTKLRKFCGDHKIHISAYMPLGAPGNLWGSTCVVEHPTIKSIAFKHNATPAQVALRWGLSKGASVIVKSFNAARMNENMAALTLKLDEHDILEIEKMEEKKIIRGDFVVNETTSPYKTIQDLWDNEI